MNKRREFGEQLRRQRERRGVSLAKIAEETKVAASLFASLERGDCSRWPGGLYNRGYVRAYAAAIGLDPEDTLVAFVRCFGNADPNGAATVTVEHAPGEIRRPPTPLRLQLASDPAVSRRHLARRARYAFCEIAAVAILGWVLNLLTGVDLGVSVASVLLTLHAAERVSGRTLDRLLVRSGRPKSRAALAPAEDVPDADPAHSAA